MKLYAGIYRHEGKKVLQISDGRDGLSPEILANPGMVEVEAESLKALKVNILPGLGLLGCHHLEINTSDRYEFI